MNRRSIFDRVRDAVDPREYYADTLPTMPDKQPGRDGWKDGGLCPFHDDRRPGSFRVNVQTGAYRCFSCGACGGDIVAFEAAILPAAPLTAARSISREWGVEQ